MGSGFQGKADLGQLGQFTSLTTEFREGTLAEDMLHHGASRVLGVQGSEP